MQPEVVFEILGNSRFGGMAPELSIYKKNSDFYRIKFQSGKGAGWGLHGREYAEDRIRDVVDINVRMYEFAKGRLNLRGAGMNSRRLLMGCTRRFERVICQHVGQANEP